MEIATGMEHATPLKNVVVAEGQVQARVPKVSACAAHVRISISKLQIWKIQVFMLSHWKTNTTSAWYDVDVAPPHHSAQCSPLRKVLPTTSILVSCVRWFKLAWRTWQLYPFSNLFALFHCSCRRMWFYCLRKLYVFCRDRVSWRCMHLQSVQMFV